MLYYGNKKNWIVENWAKRREKGDFIAKQCRVGRKELIEAI